MNNPKLMISIGVGVKNTIDLKDTVKYALDTVPMLRIIEFGFYAVLIGTVVSIVFKIVKKQQIHWKKTLVKPVLAAALYILTFIPEIEQFLGQDRLLLLSAIEILCAGTVVWQVWKFISAKLLSKKEFNTKKAIINGVLAAIVYGLTYVPAIYEVLIVVYLPVMTY